MSGHTIQSSSPMNLLPSASSIVNLADSQERAAFANIMKMKEEPMDVESVDSNKEEVSKGQLLSIFYFKKKNMTWMQKIALFLWVGEIDMELGGVSSDDNTSSKEPPKKELQEPKQSINTLLQRQAKFLETCREVKVSYI